VIRAGKVCFRKHGGTNTLFLGLQGKGITMKKWMHPPRLLIVLALMTLIVPALTQAESEEAWYPSRYGAGDELGAANELTPAKILEAVKLVGNGQVYDLGTNYEAKNPGAAPRYWETLILAHGAVTPLGTNKFLYVEETFTGCPGKGTQLDGFAHVCIDGVFYNGVPMKDVLDARGVKKFGVENYRPMITRGVLVDMVKVRGRPLDGGEAVTVEDIEGFLKGHNLEVRPGDAVLIRTGWMRYFDDPGKYIGPEPGITKAVAKWMHEHRVVLVGTDNWATEVYPGEVEGELLPVHQALLTKYGIHLGQFMVLDELAKDEVYEFMFVFICPKIKGITQGIGRPLAIAKGPSPCPAPKLGAEPSDDKWWPSRYGADDLLGAMNELTGAKVVEAADLVTEGRVWDLGTNYEAKNPGAAPRFWHTLVLGHGGVTPLGTNKFLYLEEVFSGCPGKGTQLDGFAHVCIDGVFYNGVPMKDVLDAKGVKKFGVENYRPMVTRGVLVDMVKARGRDLEGGEAVTVEDIEGFLKAHKLEVRPGDAVLIRTGWMRYFDDPGKYIGPEPGITKAVAKWMHEHRVVLVGTDNWATEVYPGEVKGELLPVHQALLTKYGIYQGQFMVLDDLAKDEVYEFMLLFNCPKIKGLTQGIARPLAVR